MRRKFYLLAIAAIIIFIGFVSTDSSADYVCGDANSDGLLNVSDAVFIINYVFIGGPAPDPNCCVPDIPVCPSTVTDYDGNVYQTVLIGDRCWMMENLKVTHYRNGDPIPHVTSNSSWGGLSTGAYCDFNNEGGNVETYGRLYNWYAVNDSRPIAPKGWHVPTDTEWKQLERYLGMSQTDANNIGWRGTDEGGKLKEAGTVHWSTPNSGATNASGFTALPGGVRYDDGAFYGMGIYAFFWSSSEYVGNLVWGRALSHQNAQIGRDYNNKRLGISIRCVKDLDASGGYVCGDANSDGALNVSDAVFIINHVFIGGPAPDPGCCGDCPSTITDYDGNVYETVLIGDQCWMKENLKVTHYRNGDPIPNVTDDAAWEGLSTGAYCNYNNDEGNVATYGRFYNWFAVNDSRNIAPEGWHVPSDEEVKHLEMYLGMNQTQADASEWRGTDEGGKMKEVGTAHWNYPNTGATNESGFTALPGGWRTIYGLFCCMGDSFIMWTSTPYSDTLGWFRSLTWEKSQVFRSGNYRQTGFSVRCVKNQ